MRFVQFYVYVYIIILYIILKKINQSINDPTRGQPGVDAPEAKLHHAGKWKGESTENVKEP